MPKTFATQCFCVAFEEASGSEKDYGLERGGVSRLSVEKKLSHNAEKFREGTICVVFQKTSAGGKEYG